MDISEQSLEEIYNKFRKHHSRLYKDIQKTFEDDDKSDRKNLENEIKITQSILSNILKLRSIIAES